MAEVNQIYRCALCGQIVEVLIAGAGALVCCGNNMQHLIENTTEAAKEKHIPVITKIDGGYKVSVGSVAHPMEEKHSIQFIELTVGGVTQIKHLKPGDQPEAVFNAPEGEATAREYCNLHGLWKG
ncbi:MAG: desulfoferrodoxin [Deltaproteobacteria bacterium]|jgi:superoxide reductase|nr:desulfoferrodoxin [Deltaproteobacteria bacterium]